jgi:hypothetical protein
MILGDEYELCSSRHETPAHGKAIFPNEVADPLDFAGLEIKAAQVLEGYKHNYLYVYVTASSTTTAVVAVINVCREKNIRLILMHYDRESGRWFEQYVTSVVGE